MKIKRNPNLATLSRQFIDLGSAADAMGRRINELNQLTNRKEFNVIEIDTPIEEELNVLYATMDKIKDLIRTL